VLETDIAAVTNVNFQSITKMKKLLAFIAQSVPFKPNITRLAEVIETKRDTTMLYLEYLQRASVIRMLNVSGQTMGRLSKPEKIYLDNTNLAFALCLETPNIGNLRETFLLSQLTAQCKVEASPVSDFLVNGKFTFECGSKNKQNKQVKEVKNSFIIKDDLLTGSKNEIPLWLFGFLY
jgi:predicted AAA+ superfamily ATPase